jgi:Glycosyl hydrolase family 26/Cellulose or protein binding domain
MTVSIRRPLRRPRRRIVGLLIAALLATGMTALTKAGPAAADTAPNGFPYCSGSSVDPDGDGWGWENSASCVVRGSTADPARLASNGFPYCSSSAVDPDGDGWGWERSMSCVVSGSAADPAGSSGGGSTGGGSTSCNVSPADSNATQPARKVLCYIYSQYGNHIISGQQESTWVSGPDYEMNIIHNASGKYPAIRGMDMGDSPDFGSRALAWWNAGGIPMVSYHMGAPNQNVDGYAGSQLTANINNALAAGTADHTRLTQRLDNWAAQLKTVQNGGGAVIIRPWHEAGGTWFWWSKEGGSQYKRLWQYTFTYLTQTKGLHNLVWLMPYDGSPDASFNPGKAYYDIGGADTYASDHGPLTSLFNSTKSIFGSTVPIALHENGRIPDPAQLQSTATRWVLFNTWHTTFISDTSVNPTSTVNSVYNSAYVVTRDELPSLK